MPEITSILLDLFIIFAIAKVVGEVFQWVRQPAVVGEILAGIVIGPHVLGLIGTPGGGLVELFHGDEAAAQEALDIVFEVISELGVIVLLFFVGLETKLEDLLRVGRRSATVAALGVVVPFVLGLVFMILLGRPQVEAVFIGTAMVATSVGITARVLRDLGVIGSREARIILAAAVVDDILAILLLTVVSGLGEGRGVQPGEVALIAAQAIAFTAFVAYFGTHGARRFSLQLARLRLPHAPFAVAMALMLGLATLAGEMGLAAIIGAFLAGLVLAESREQFQLDRQVAPVYEFLVPFFFVIIGSKVDPSLLGEAETLGIAVGVTLLAVAGKVVGCGLGGLGLGRRPAAIIGVGMVPRGEVGLIVASIGLSLAAVSQEMFSVVVIMSIATTLLAPPLLVLLFRNYGFATVSAGEEERVERLPEP